MMKSDINTQFCSHLVPVALQHGQVLHKAYDEIRDFCRLLSHSLPIASLLDKLCIKPTTKSDS